MGRLDGKIALITGAARGQGRSHAVRFAEEGAAVAALDIAGQIDAVAYPLATPDDLQQTGELLAKVGGLWTIHQADTRDQGSLDAAVAEVQQRFGRIDVVVANAGIATYGNVWTLSEEEFTAVVDVNLVGTWRTVKAVAPTMLSQRSGSIILIGSVASTRGMLHNAHYVASKHGVVGLMRTACLEFAPYGIRVNTIAPGGVLTGMIDNDVTRRLFRPELESPTLDDLAELSRAQHPMGIPWLDASDISAAAVYLASEEARYVTGTILAVDGGMATR
jgi:SDR family mycofactocin-dependent oxidoreductase